MQRRIFLSLGALALAASLLPAAALPAVAVVEPHAVPVSASAPPLMLANVYRPGVVLADYWVSEKYDGVRGYWDGQALWTRGGERVAVPAWFTAGWPGVPLDGELRCRVGRSASEFQLSMA